jgi:amino acid transporter
LFSNPLHPVVCCPAGLDQRLEPLWWFLFYATALIIHLRGGNFFWKFNWWFAIILIALHFVYVFCTIPSMDTANLSWPSHVKSPLAKDDNDHPYFVGGFHGFMTVLALPTWFYIGVECLTLGCEEAYNHKKSVGRGLIACMLTLFLCMIGSLFASVLNGPTLAAVSDAVFPFNYGFQRLCNSANAVMTLWSLPATYGTCFGFIYGNRHNN